jgi:signal transduction histidine kinase/CheY-like chemotaxis protein/HAMP domain-containing protein
MSLIALASIALLGLISNYFFKTSKVLGVMINSERVQNNTFQEGVECYYKYQITGNAALLDSAIERINAANQMAYIFGTIDQYLQLPEEEYLDVFYKSYGEAYGYDRTNGNLMASRINLFLILRKDKITQAQQIGMSGYQLGEQIKKKIEIIKRDGPNADNNIDLESDLAKMRGFYRVFAKILTSLIEYANFLLFWGTFLIVVLLMVLLWIASTIIARSISRPMQTMVENFKVIAKGNLETEIKISANNEIGQLATSFREIQSGLHSVIEYTKKVAEGDYSQSITPRSAEDELSIALNKMVAQLKNSYDKSQQDSWFKTGINQLNEKLGGDKNLNDLSTVSLDFVMKLLHSQLGSMHLYNTEYQFLKLVASSGFDPKKLKERIKLNEGILGQVAHTKELFILSEIPPESYTSYSASGTYIPKQVVVVPLVFNETLVGVLELSSIHAYSNLEIDFLKEAAEIIAINISSASNLLKTNELLQKTQEQANQLQVQQEELRVANEELTEHTKVLTESEKRLQVQQEELRVANEELEERTRQLEIQKEDIGYKNKELTEIKENLESKAVELQQASQYKSEFLANMSHELRTPLNSLLILSNLLANNKKGNLTAEQVQSAKIIYKSGTDLLFLINEVLDLSKIEAGKMTLEFAAVNASDFKDEILADFKALADDKHLEFKTLIQPEFPLQIETDRYRLMQIIKNLLSNAFKFTKEGSVIVEFFMPSPSTVFTVPGLNLGNSCGIKVKDSGVGIPAEKLNLIFGAFQQADGSISRRFGGTGLGLSISRELIKMLGGEIQLESAVNEGSTFYVLLPIHQNQKLVAGQNQVPNEKPVLVQKPEPEPKQPEVEKEISLPIFIDDDRQEAGSHRAVLIIHSSKVQANKYMQQVRAKNFSVVVAASIPDGIVLAEKFNPRAIMLAVDLVNDKPSYDLLKSHSAIKKLPIHIISPIEYENQTEETELKTIESTEFSDILKSIENEGISTSKKLLLIEDDLQTRQIIKSLFSEFDISIDEAGFAEEAFKILSNKTFDCIILDLGLPDYTGKELLEKLKANHIDIPKVIVYTGKEISKEEHKNLSAYTNAIILKGLKSDERLMDEVTLFLHQVSKSMPEHKHQAVNNETDTLFKGKKILVVDDEIRNVFALGKILEDREIDVFEAENGAVAIEVLKGNKEIDLVLMDVMMPVMDGYEAMRAIRSMPEIQNIPIICLTAKAMKEDHENALKNGANDYLSKPVNIEKLFAMLKIWLYKK